MPETSDPMCAEDDVEQQTEDTSDTVEYRGIEEFFDFVVDSQ